MNLGDFDLSAVIYHKFTTFRPSTGAPFTLAGTPALSVYKDSSVTQSTTGVTLTADFDSVTGLNHVAIDTSADGTFYSAGSFFDIVVTTGTVDSVSAVGTVVGRFTIRKNSALKPTTAARTLDVDASGGTEVGSFQAGALTSAAFAANAIDSSAIAATAAIEIAGAVWDELTASHTTANTFGKALSDILAAVASTGAVLTAAERNAIADAFLARANGIETGVTPKQAMQYMAAALAGVLSGAATTTESIQAIGNAATLRITATVDANGNRSAIVLS